jgi:Zn finger protein HypA/HybF involved in hydrogenase expression
MPKWDVYLGCQYMVRQEVPETFSCRECGEVIRGGNNTQITLIKKKIKKIQCPRCHRYSGGIIYAR